MAGGGRIRNTRSQEATIIRPVPPAIAPVLAAAWALLAPAAPAGATGFTDVTDTALQFPLPGVTYGLGWGDFDSDGDRDCFICRHHRRPTIYENQADGTFNVTLFPPIFPTSSDHHGGLVADVDQDGDLDIYLTGGADAGASAVLKVMYRNDGDLEFKDMALAWGLADSLARGRSPSAIDLEGDGDIDVFVAKAPQVLSPNSLFLNDGAQNFTDIASSAGVADDFGSGGGLWGDFDRDGDPDLLIAGEEEATFETHLYRNEGDLTFTDVTAMLPATNQLGGADWGDYDNDGDLDLAVGYGDLALFDAVTWTPDSVEFFFNTRYGDNGLDGFAFTQSGDSATYAPVLDGSYQADKVFISESEWSPSIVPFTLPFEIFGTPTFFPGDPPAFYLWTHELLDIWELRATAPPVAGHSFAGWITTNGQFTEVAAAGLEPYTHGPRGTRLWRNDGSAFTDVTVAAGLDDTLNVHCAAWVDVDQDGRLDLYVLGKGDTEAHNEPNVFYRNQGGGLFADQTALWQLEGPTEGLGDAFAFEDYDEDGDLDVLMLSGSGPVFIADEERARLYRNDGTVGNRLRVDLQGTLSTRDGYGAWVTCVGAPGGPQHHYVTGNNWRGAQAMLDPYFGLGPVAVADSVIVEWPSGVVDVLTSVPAGSVLIVESDPTAAPGSAVAGVAPLRLVASPQPSSGVVELRMSGRREVPAKLTVFDAAGRHVHSQRLAAGSTTARWDGRSAGGEPVAAGVYFVRLSEGRRVTNAKVVRVRP